MGPGTVKASSNTSGSTRPLWVWSRLMLPRVTETISCSMPAGSRRGGATSSPPPAQPVSSSESSRNDTMNHLLFMRFAPNGG